MVFHQRGLSCCLSKGDIANDLQRPLKVRPFHLLKPLIGLKCQYLENKPSVTYKLITTIERTHAVCMLNKW